MSRCPHHQRGGCGCASLKCRSRWFLTLTADPDFRGKYCCSHSSGHPSVLAEGDIAKAHGAVPERGVADGGVATAGYTQIASILAKKGITSAEVVHEERAALVDIAGSGRGILERQVANDVIRARRALRASITLRPLGPLRPGSTRSTLRPLCTLGSGIPFRPLGGLRPSRALRASWPRGPRRALWPLR